MKKIVTYDEIPDKKEIFLSGLSLSHFPLPQLVEEARRCDSRLTKELAFFALGEKGELLGRAGVALTKVETKEGGLRVGVVWGVRTSPWRTKEGVARILMDHVHEYLKTKEVDVFSLGVAKYNVAHQLYTKMGYREVDEGIRRTALKWADEKKGGGLRVSPYSYGDAEQVQQIMNRSNEGLYGYTSRDIDFISKRRFLGHYNPENVSVYRDGDEAVGYCAFRSKYPVVEIGEIRAMSEAEYRSMLAEIECAFAGLPILVSNGFSMKEKTWLSRAGFTVQPGDYGTEMLHGLGRRSAQDIGALLGAQEGLFRQQTLFDSF